MSAHVGIPQTTYVGGGSLSVRTRINQIHDSAIPNDWSVRTLGEIGQCLIGLTYDPKNISANGVLVLRSSNIDNNTLQFGDDIYVEMDIPERINVREGDLLICVRNGSRPLIGKCALIERQAAGMTFGAFMSVFRSNDSRFVSYYFQSDIVKRQIHKHLGATINQITNKSLNSFEIPYPGSRGAHSHRRGVVGCGRIARGLGKADRQEACYQAGRHATTSHRRDPPTRVQRVVEAEAAGRSWNPTERKWVSNRLSGTGYR